MCNCWCIVLSIIGGVCGGVNGSIFVSMVLLITTKIPLSLSLEIHLRNTSLGENRFHTSNELVPVRKNRSLSALVHIYPNGRLFVVVAAGRRGERDEGKGKKKAERRSRPSFYSVPCSSGMERRGEEGGKKNEEDNACSRVGAVLNGNRLASEVPGSWVTWRQGDTVAPPTVRWICRLAARLPQGRSFRVGVDPSGRRDARTPPTPAEPWRGKKSGCTTATVLPCRFRAAAFTLRG